MNVVFSLLEWIFNFRPIITWNTFLNMRKLWNCRAQDRRYLEIFALYVLNCKSRRTNGFIIYYNRSKVEYLSHLLFNHPNWILWQLSTSFVKNKFLSNQQENLENTNLVKFDQKSSRYKKFQKWPEVDIPCAFWRKWQKI